MHAGHYIHNRLDFDQRNIRVQCPKDNTYLHGRLDVYTIKLIEELGMDGLHQLRKDAFQHPGYTRADLVALIEKYKSYANA